MLCNLCLCCVCVCAVSVWCVREAPGKRCRVSLVHCGIDGFATRSGCRVYKEATSHPVPISYTWLFVLHGLFQQCFVYTEGGVYIRLPFLLHILSLSLFTYPSLSTLRSPQYPLLLLLLLHPPPALAPPPSSCSCSSTLLLLFLLHPPPLRLLPLLPSSSLPRRHRRVRRARWVGGIHSLHERSQVLLLWAVVLAVLQLSSILFWVEEVGG